jgi:hypothetical protein
MQGRTVLSLVAFLCAGALVALRTSQFLEDPSVPGRPSWAMQDFRGAIYYPVRQLLAGQNPYAPADDPQAFPPLTGAPLYLPMTLTVHLPLGLLSRRPAELVYFVGNLLAVPLLVLLALRLCGRVASVATVLSIAAAVVLTRPVSMALFVGQSTIVCALGIYLALHLARSRPSLGGVGLAIACIKPTFGLPLGFLMLWRGEMKAFAVGAVLVTALCVPATMLAARAAGGLGPLLASMDQHGLAKAEKPDVSEVTSVYRVDTVALFGRFRGRRFDALATAAIGAAVLVAAGWALRRCPRDLATALVCLAVVACMYHQLYDALILVAPLIGLIAWARRPGIDAPRWLLLVLLAIPAVNYLPTPGMLDRLGLDEGPLRLAAISVNGAAVFLALLTSIALALFAPGPDSAEEPVSSVSRD